MKVDIEGHDIACIETMMPATGMPRYISLEVYPLPFDRMDNVLLLLEQRGYIWFKLTFQSIFCPAVCPFGCGSGLFGEDAVDALSGLAWRSRQAVAQGLSQYVDARRGNWWDLHARQL